MTSPLNLPIVQGHSLGPFILGASIHDILARIKAAPTLYPRIHVAYSQAHPILAPINITLPSNGLRLRFDGPEQRLRLIEILDFSKSNITYKGHDISKANNRTTANGDNVDHLAGEFDQMTVRTGPQFRSIYKIFGPTTPGEYIPPQQTSETPSTHGTYVLSYPGVAFSFPLQDGRWSPSIGWSSIVSMLSSSAAGATTSLAVYMGESWTAARSKLFSAEIPLGTLRSLIPSGLRKENMPKEIESARVYDHGRIELVRKDAPNFWIVLGETTPQDLVSELGPPDTIHKKNDSRVSIHRPRKGSTNVDSRRNSSTSGVHVDVERAGNYPESDPSSRAVSSESDDDDEEDDPIVSEDKKNSPPEQVFYNYYSHGFDILIGQPTTPSFISPTATNPQLETLEKTDSNSSAPQNNPAVPNIPDTAPALSRSHLTATKIIVHGNIPGSWTFNRYRRLRWTLESVPEPSSDVSKPLTSETTWKDIQHRLQKVFRDHYASPEEARLASLPMVVNRGWGREEAGTDSDWGVVGGFEDVGGGTGSVVRKGEEDTDKLGAAEVYGFPGLVFEVLKNGAISDVLIF